MRSIVVAPTKELATQIYDVLRGLLKFHAASAAVLSPLQQDEEDEEKLVQVLKEDWFIRRQREEDLTTEEVIMLRAEQFQVTAEEDILKQLRTKDRKETEVITLLQKRPEETWETEGIVYHKGRIYIPPDPNL